MIIKGEIDIIKMFMESKYYLSAQWHQFHWDPFESWLKEINRRGLP